MTNAIIKEWAERHDLQGTLTDLRSCFDDARSLSNTPPANTSAVIEAETAKLREALEATRDELMRLYGGVPNHFIGSQLGRQVDAALAASAQPETSPTAATVSNETEGDTARLEWVMRKVSGGAWAAIGVWYDAGCNREAIDKARSLSPSEPSGHGGQFFNEEST